MNNTPRPPRHAPPRPWYAATLVLGALVLGACGGGPGPELVAFTPTVTPAPTATPEPAATPTPQPTPEPEVLSQVQEAEPVVMWAVTDAVNSLNVRAAPSTSAEIVATLGPGDSGLAGTGETATADGFDWIQIAADDQRAEGWVAAKFLVGEDPATG